MTLRWHTHEEKPKLPAGAQAVTALFAQRDEPGDTFLCGCAFYWKPKSGWAAESDDVKVPAEFWWAYEEDVLATLPPQFVGAAPKEQPSIFDTKPPAPPEPDVLASALRTQRLALAALRKIRRIRRPEDEEYEIADLALKRITAPPRSGGVLKGSRNMKPSSTKPIGRSRG